MKFTKITKEVFDATEITTTDIKYYAADATPVRIKNLFQKVAWYYILVPLTHLESVIQVLTGRNKKGIAYEYTTKTLTGNIVAIAVKFDRL